MAAGLEVLKEYQNLWGLCLHKTPTPAKRFYSS
jgi:hypothetical protein